MDLTKALAPNVIRRGAGRALARRPKPSWQLSLLEAPITISRRRDDSPKQPPAARDPKTLSLELEMGGLAVEFKAKGLRGLVTWAAIDLLIAAVVQELIRPRQFRTWHGRVAGVVPYDFRKPTLRRVLDAVWAPNNPRLFTDTVWGVGWSVNLAQLPRVLMSGGKRPSGSSGANYVAPRLPSGKAS